MSDTVHAGISQAAAHEAALNEISEELYFSQVLLREKISQWDLIKSEVSNEGTLWENKKIKFST